MFFLQPLVGRFLGDFMRNLRQKHVFGTLLGPSAAPPVPLDLKCRQGLKTKPFGVLTQTSFLAERAIGYVVSVGLKFMALGVILGIGLNIFNTYTLSPEPTVPEECGLLLAAVFLMMLALKIPSIAGALRRTRASSLSP